MKRLEVSGAVRPLYVSLGVKRLTLATAAGAKTYSSYQKHDSLSLFDVVFFF